VSRPEPRVRNATLRLGAQTFGPADYAVMAIVNRTPDSFYDRGATFAQDAALRAVEAAVDAGADIIDIGGVKAGPGVEVDAEEELRRTVPTVAAVRKRFPRVVISIDTWRARVAREAVAAGADLLNDTWAGADPELAAWSVRTPVACARAPARTGPRSPTWWRTWCAPSPAWPNARSPPGCARTGS
jgi:dihydropteroate synthase